jgi:hypothetical protein
MVTLGVIVFAAASGLCLTPKGSAAEATIVALVGLRAGVQSEAEVQEAAEGFTA